MTTFDTMRDLLRGAVIGQDYSDATLKSLGIPEKEWDRVRGVAADVRQIHKDGDHRAARQLADQWAQFFAAKSAPPSEPSDDFDPLDPDELARRIPR